MRGKVLPHQGRCGERRINSRAFTAASMRAVSCCNVPGNASAVPRRPDTPSNPPRMPAPVPILNCRRVIIGSMSFWWPDNGLKSHKRVILARAIRKTRAFTWPEPISPQWTEGIASLGKILQGANPRPSKRPSQRSWLRAASSRLCASSHAYSGNLVICLVTPN